LRQRGRQGSLDCEATGGSTEWPTFREVRLPDLEQSPRAATPEITDTVVAQTVCKTINHRLGVSGVNKGLGISFMNRENNCVISDASQHNLTCFHEAQS